MISTEFVGDDGRVALIQIARGDKRNALDATHWQALADAVLEAPQRSARAIVITGEGSSFCAGADFNETNAAALTAACANALAAVDSVAVPVVAQVNGPAIGAGLMLAIACDLRVVENAARFAIPAAAISRPVDPVSVRRLVSLIGVGRAGALLLAGDSVSGDAALQNGLADRAGDIQSTLEWANQMAGHAPTVMSYLKLELRHPGLTEAQYSTFVADLSTSADLAEAESARLEKRPPRFTGA